MNTATLELASPLYGVKSAAELAALPYFDALACLGELSLHCGGIRNTAELLYAARADGHSQILEVGCGTGATTRALLRAGLQVAVVEPSRRMVAAMVRNCLMNAGRVPEHHVASAEDLGVLESGRFDIVLLECVFGFVQDKAAAVAEMRRVLKPGGVIAVTDFHYVSEPDTELRARLRRELGIAQLLSRADWERSFESLCLSEWTEVPMGTGGIDRTSIELMVGDARLTDAFPDGAIGLEALAQRFAGWEALSAANRRHMAGFNALWRKPQVTA